jgi:hypothetical protein
MKEQELYAALEKVSGAYFVGNKDDAARAAALAYFDRFTFLAEPGLRPFYYQLNPGFWNWIEALTGKKLK